MLGLYKQDVIAFTFTIGMLLACIANFVIDSYLDNKEQEEFYSSERCAGDYYNTCVSFAMLATD